MTTLKNLNLSWIVFGVFAALFYPLNANTNIAIDDFAYKFIKLDKYFPLGQRVTNISDIIATMKVHYFETNGRLLLNGLAQLFLISDNKFYFDILNTFMMCLLLLIVYLHSGKHLKELNLVNIIFLILCFWFLIPGPNHTILWLTGSVNYLWATTIVLLFLLVYKKNLEKKNNTKYYFLPGLFIIGFLSGFTHEVITVGVSGALFVYHITKLKELKPDTAILIIGFMLGTLLLVLGPGNFIRLTGGTELNPGFLQLILQRLGGIILSIRDNVALIVLLIFLIILKIKKDKLINSFIREQGIFLLSILFSLIFIVLAGAYQPRVFFGISVFSILLLFNLFAGRQQKSNSVLLISSFVIVTVIMIIEWKNVYTDLKFNYATFKADEIIWRSNDQNVFPLPKKKYNRFVSNGLGGIDKDFWSNKVMSAYYKKDHMVFIPHDLHSNIQKNTAIKDLEEADLRAFNIKNRDTSLINNHTLFYQEDSGYFILPIKQSNANLEKGDLIFITLDGFEKASFTPKETFMYYILNKEIPTINKESAQYYLIVLNDKRYLVFKKPEQIPIDKLDNIQLFDSKDNVLTVISL